MCGVLKIPTEHYFVGKNPTLAFKKSSIRFTWEMEDYLFFSIRENIFANREKRLAFFISRDNDKSAFRVKDEHTPPDCPSMFITDLPRCRVNIQGRKRIRVLLVLSQQKLCRQQKERHS